MDDPVVLITGAGASHEHGVPNTANLTSEVEDRLTGEGATTEPAVRDLYRAVVQCLQEYLPKPMQMTFEQIHQALMDVADVAVRFPRSDHTPNESVPIVAATHDIRHVLARFEPSKVLQLQQIYRRTILRVVLKHLDQVSSVEVMDAACARLSEGRALWSFTLNYDDLIDRCLRTAVTGFRPGPEPRPFQPGLLTRALQSGQAVHCHLHGSVRWGYPDEREPGTGRDLTDICEYDSAARGVDRCEPAQAYGFSSQSGRFIPFATIVTGLSKTDMLLQQPYFAYQYAFQTALEQCGTLIVAGYGFSDLHVNAAIRELFMHRPDAQVYFVDYGPGEDAADYVGRFASSRDAYLTITRGKWSWFSPEAVPGFPGWSCIRGGTADGASLAEIGVWLRGFKSFCEAVAKSALPPLASGAQP